VQTPVAHGVQVTLEPVRRQPFGRTAILPFPAPLNVKQDRGFFAYRTEGLEAVVIQNHAVTHIEKSLVAAIFTEWIGGPWRTARQEDLGEPTRAFWRDKSGFLPLSLKPPAAQARCDSEVSWRVGPRQASVRATAKLTSPDTNLAMVDWEVPGALSIVEVSGPQVHHWTRTGPRLQVWLQRPMADAP